MADVVPSIEALALRKCDGLGEGVERPKRAFGPALPVHPKRLGRNAITPDRRVSFSQTLFVIAGVQLVGSDGPAWTPEAHARLAAIGEIDAARLKRAAESGKVVGDRRRSASFEVPESAFAHLGCAGELSLNSGGEGVIDSAIR